MTVFAHKRFGQIDWFGIQNRIEALMISLGGPNDLMMFSRDTDDRQGMNIYIGLPDRRYLASFPGFAEIDRAALPSRMAIAVLNSTGFEQRFPDIQAKLKGSKERAWR